MISSNVAGAWSHGPVTASSAVFALGIPPYPGPQGSAPNLYQLTGGSNRPNWWGPGGSKTFVTQMIYTSAGTAHKVGVLRPKNFCITTAVAAVNQAVINIDKDPGAYATTYRYPTPGGTTVAQVANNVIAAGDYCAYQLADGTWVFDTVASVATLAITMTTAIPNVTGGGVLKGALFFFFGIVTDKDPATGLAAQQITVPASSTQKEYRDYCSGLFSALHPGDPLLFYSPNNGADGTLDLLGGVFAGNP